MATFPCLPLWTDAYLADTKHLTTEEHGAYFLLLIQAWRSPGCSLPDDDALLARHAGMSISRWAAKKPTVMAFWKLDRRRKVWVQKRLGKEREKAADKKRKARDSAATRWKHTETDDANAMRTQCSPEPSPTQQEKPRGFSKRAVARKKSAIEELKEAFESVV